MGSKSVTRQVNCYRTKIGGKCQNSNDTFLVKVNQKRQIRNILTSFEKLMLKRSNSVTRHAIFYGQNLVKMPRMSTFENRKFAVKECFFRSKIGENAKIGKTK